VIVLIAIGVLIVWWTPVFMKRYLGIYLFLSSQTLFAMGFTIQFALPGIFFYYFPYNPPGYFDMTPFYADVMWMPLIAGIPFFFLSIFSRKKIKFEKKFQPDVITEGKTIPLPIILLIALTFIGGVVAKYYMIKTGSFYHTYRTSYQFDSYEIFVIITFLSEYFIISGLLLLAIGIRKQKSKYSWFGYIILIIELIFGIISGKRQFVGKLIIQYFTLRIACGKKVICFFATVCFLFLLMIPIMEVYSGIVSQSSMGESSLLKANDLYKIYKDSIGATSGTIKKIMFRFGDIRGTAAVYSIIPDVIDFQYGRTYTYIPFFIIPRILWPDKPDARDYAKFTKIALPLDPGSNPVSWVGEAYLNFSWSGVFIIGCLMALITRKLDDWLIPRLRAYVVFAVIWSFFSYNLILVCYSMHSLITEFLRLFIYIYPFYKLSQIAFRSQNKHRTRPQIISRMPYQK
jgi:oligosaccharide repeat unit polymerase